MRGEKVQIARKRAIIGLPAIRHLDGCGRVDDGPTLNAGLVALLFFQGIRTSIA